MGLLTDTFFIRALKSDTKLLHQLPAHDIYENVAEPDVDMKNVMLPYIIVNNDGGENHPATKDDMMEGTEDTTDISIRIVARNREELANMARRVRKTVHDYIVNSGGDDPMCPLQYNFSFSDISYENQKPSHMQMFYYRCITTNDILN